MPAASKFADPGQVRERRRERRGFQERILAALVRGIRREASAPRRLPCALSFAN